MRTGERDVPQGSPLSPPLADVALDELDHVLDRGKALLRYVRHLDDMVVLAPDPLRGRAWADRALERIREEAEAIGLSLNTDKTRVVTLTDRDAVFTFLGFDFRRTRSLRTGVRYPLLTPRAKRVTQVLRAVGEVLLIHRASPVRVALAHVNSAVRGSAGCRRAGRANR
ncbi:reverse transcriptase domain-containing protein [Sorangium sp. So ce269]